jgi:hypothetical protein
MEQYTLWNNTFLKFAVGFLAILTFSFLLLVIVGTFQNSAKSAEDQTSAGAVLGKEPGLIGY